jgi:hypothetical protein
MNREGIEGININTIKKNISSVPLQSKITSEEFEKFFFCVSEDKYPLNKYNKLLYLLIGLFQQYNSDVTDLIDTLSTMTYLVKSVGLGIYKNKNGKNRADRIIEFIKKNIKQIIKCLPINDIDEYFKCLYENFEKFMMNETKQNTTSFVKNRFKKGKDKVITNVSSKIRNFSNTSSRDKGISKEYVLLQIGDEIVILEKVGESYIYSNMVDLMYGIYHYNINILYINNNKKYLVYSKLFIYTCLINFFIKEIMDYIDSFMEHIYKYFSTFKLDGQIINNIHIILEKLILMYSGFNPELKIYMDIVMSNFYQKLTNQNTQAQRNIQAPRNNTPIPIINNTQLKELEQNKIEMELKIICLEKYLEELNSLGNPVDPYPYPNKPQTYLPFDDNSNIKKFSREVVTINGKLQAKIQASGTSRYKNIINLSRYSTSKLTVNDNTINNFYYDFSNDKYIYLFKKDGKIVKYIRDSIIKLLALTTIPVDTMNSKINGVLVTSDTPHYDDYYKLFKKFLKYYKFMNDPRQYAQPFINNINEEKIDVPRAIEICLFRLESIQRQKLLKEKQIKQQRLKI